LGNKDTSTLQEVKLAERVKTAGRFICEYSQA
jgi:hypothetical protein